MRENEKMKHTSRKWRYTEGGIIDNNLNSEYVLMLDKITAAIAKAKKGE